MTDQVTGDSARETAQSEEDCLVQALYDELIDSISRDVACGMHSMVKTGVMPYSEIVTPKSRIDVYQDIHSSADKMKESLEAYVTDVPTVKRPRRGSASEVNSEVDVGSEAATGEESLEASQISTRSNSSSQQDIWGKIPPKEPKATAKCPVCNRHISALRFAPHLDKCMFAPGRRPTTKLDL